MNKGSQEAFIVKICGQSYRLITKNREELEKAAREVERIIEGYRKKAGERATLEYLAVLSALELSERLLALENQLVRLEDNLLDINKVADKAIDIERSFPEES